MRWGDVDYKQLQKLRDNLQKLQDMDLDKFCEDVSKELAARLLALVIPRTPVGQYPRSSGKKGGTLRRGWTARTEQEAAGGGKVDPAAYANALPGFQAGADLLHRGHQPRPLCQLCGVWTPHPWRRRLGGWTVFPHPV